ncbi:hypothetical protein P3S68_005424 [Capsicum galapagoense]
MMNLNSARYCCHGYYKQGISLFSLVILPELLLFPLSQKEGQDAQDELRRRNLREELEDIFLQKKRATRTGIVERVVNGPKREFEDAIVQRRADGDGDADTKSDSEGALS